MKHCLDCGALTADTRCPTCHRARHTRMYGGRWQRLSRAKRAAAPWCERCGSREDLTLDHVEPGTLAAGVQVLCRTCNSSKKDGAGPEKFGLLGP